MRSKEIRDKIRQAKIHDNNPSWKGEDAGYIAIHVYVRKYNPPPKECQKCGEIKPLDLACITGIYNRDFSNYRYLCHKCHLGSDLTIDKSNRQCSICGSRETWVRKGGKRAGKTDWYHIDNKLACRKCYRKSIKN